MDNQLQRKRKEKILQYSQLQQQIHDRRAAKMRNRAKIQRMNRIDFMRDHPRLNSKQLRNVQMQHQQTLKKLMRDIQYMDTAQIRDLEKQSMINDDIQDIQDLILSTAPKGRSYPIMELIIKRLSQGYDLSTRLKLGLKALSQQGYSLERLYDEQTYVKMQKMLLNAMTQKDEMEEEEQFQQRKMSSDEEEEIAPRRNAMDSESQDEPQQSKVVIRDLKMTEKPLDIIPTFGPDFNNFINRAPSKPMIPISPFQNFSWQPPRPALPSMQMWIGPPKRMEAPPQLPSMQMQIQPPLKKRTQASRKKQQRLKSLSKKKQERQIAASLRKKEAQLKKEQKRAASILKNAEKQARLLQIKRLQEKEREEKIKEKERLQEQRKQRQRLIDQNKAKSQASARRRKEKDLAKKNLNPVPILQEQNLNPEPISQKQNLNPEPISQKQNRNPEPIPVDVQAVQQDEQVVHTILFKGQDLYTTLSQIYPNMQRSLDDMKQRGAIPLSWKHADDFSLLIICFIKPNNLYPGKYGIRQCSLSQSSFIISIRGVNIPQTDIAQFIQKIKGPYIWTRQSPINPQQLPKRDQFSKKSLSKTFDYTLLVDNIYLVQDTYRGNKYLGMRHCLEQQLETGKSVIFPTRYGINFTKQQFQAIKDRVVQAFEGKMMYAIKQIQKRVTIRQKQKLPSFPVQIPKIHNLTFDSVGQIFKYVPQQKIIINQDGKITYNWQKDLEKQDENREQRVVLTQEDGDLGVKMGRSEAARMRRRREINQRSQQKRLIGIRQQGMKLAIDAQRQQKIRKARVQNDKKQAEIARKQLRATEIKRLPGQIRSSEANRPSTFDQRDLPPQGFDITFVPQYFARKYPNIAKKIVLDDKRDKDNQKRGNDKDLEQLIRGYQQSELYEEMRQNLYRQNSALVMKQSFDQDPPQGWKYVFQNVLLMYKEKDKNFSGIINYGFPWIIAGTPCKYEQDLQYAYQYDQTSKEEFKNVNFIVKTNTKFQMAKSSIIKYLQDTPYEYIIHAPSFFYDRLLWPFPVNAFHNVIYYQKFPVKFDNFSKEKQKLIFEKSGKSNAGFIQNYASSLIIVQHGRDDPTPQVLLQHVTQFSNPELLERSYYIPAYIQYGGKGLGLYAGKNLKAYTFIDIYCGQVIYDYGKQTEGSYDLKILSTNYSVSPKIFRSAATYANYGNRNNKNCAVSGHKVGNQLLFLFYTTTDVTVGTQLLWDYGITNQKGLWFSADHAVDHDNSTKVKPFI